MCAFIRMHGFVVMTLEENDRTRDDRQKSACIIFQLLITRRTTLRLPLTVALQYCVY